LTFYKSDLDYIDDYNKEKKIITIYYGEIIIYYDSNNIHSELINKTIYPPEEDIKKLKRSITVQNLSLNKILNQAFKGNTIGNWWRSLSYYAYAV